MGLQQKIICYLTVILFVWIVSIDGRLPRKKKVKKPTETSFLNFLRLLVLRLIYGFATMIGADEAVSDFMGGVLVPPGVEDDDYRDYADDDGIDY